MQGSLALPPTLEVVPGHIRDGLSLLGCESWLLDVLHLPPAVGRLALDHARFAGFDAKLALVGAGPVDSVALLLAVDLWCSDFVA